jgi:small subunit ribosomal protein S3Ae
MAESKTALKIVKKKWLAITASKFFNSELLGECYVPSPDFLMDRTVSANLANLTGDIRQQSITLKFIVTTVDGERGVAEVIGYVMASSAIRRIVRRGSDRLDESFICETADGQKVQIKPMIITKAITNSAVHRSLRKALVANVTKQVKKFNFDSLINEIITSKLQMAIKSELKKIFPLKGVEIKALYLKSKPLEKPAEAQAEAVEQPAAEAPAA